MAIHRLKPVSEQQATKDGWGIVVAASGLKGPYVKGDGPDDFVCGACQAVLLKGVPPGVVIRNMAPKCPECGTINVWVK